MWIAIALAAGVCQTVRNALARGLVGRVSSPMISWARFAFNLPFAALLLGVLVLRNGAYALSGPFLGLCAAAAVTQLVANIALVEAFRRTGFARSIVFHKLEVVLVALVGLALFGERPSPFGWVGIGACTLGVLAMNLGRAGGDGGRARRALTLDAGGALALGCALLLVATSFCLKEANARFALDNPRLGEGRFQAAANTLFHTTWIEVAVLTAALCLTRPADLLGVRRNAGRMALMGVAAFAGSLGWFWSFSLTLVAYVKAVGQIESVLAVAFALFVLREREVERQLVGVALVLLGILLVLLG